MASVYPININRLANFSRDQQNGVAIDPAALDAELNQILVVTSTLSQLVKGITNADGSLAFTIALREMFLMEQLAFTGVSGASQTVTVPTYNNATQLALVYVNGLVLPASAITYPSATTITITHTFVGGEAIQLNLFNNGAGCLTSLASTAINLGAALVGIHNVGGIYVSTTVEAALQEVMTKLNTLITQLGTIGNYILANGTVSMSASLNAGGFKIINGAAATNPTDFVIYSQLTAYTNIWNNLSANYLLLGGGTMSGALNMGSNQINNVAMAGTPATTDAANVAYVTAQLTAVAAPIGSVIAYVGVGAPTGWLLCDGSAINRTTYPGLNTVLSAAGYPFGTGDGSTTFNVPDLLGRVVVGAGTGSAHGTLLPKTLGTTSGEELHTLTIQETPPHYHTFGYSTNEFGGGSLGAATNDNRSGAQPTSGATNGTNVPASTPHNNMQPYNVLTYIIRAA